MRRPMTTRQRVWRRIAMYAAHGERLFRAVSIYASGKHWYGPKGWGANGTNPHLYNVRQTWHNAWREAGYEE